MPAKPLIIVSLEGIAPNALSCYGCSWNQTPTLDEISSRGWIWDRLIAENDDPKELLKTWVHNDVAWANQFKKLGPLVLISDQEDHDFDNHCFDEITILPVEPIHEEQQPADEAFETRFGQLIATAIERISQPDKTGAIWIHSTFLNQSWDAPSLLDSEEEESDPYLAEHQTEDDGNVEVEQEIADFDDVGVPELVATSVVPPSFKLEPKDDPDLLPQWMDRYGNQVKLLDLMLGYLVEEVERVDAQLMFIGTSGFRLGQNKEFGLHPAHLRYSDIHIPLLLTGRGPLRIPHLTGSQEVIDLLLELGRNDDRDYPAERWAESRSSVRSISIQSSRCRYAVTDPNWFCVIESDGEESLFLKPDDIDDYNNVARLRPDVVDDLTESN